MIKLTKCSSAYDVLHRGNMPKEEFKSPISPKPPGNHSERSARNKEFSY